MYKNIFLFSCLLFLYMQAARAQDQPQVGCNDKVIRLQAEQLKADFKQQGLTVYKDAMMSMESQQPYPIAVQLTKGQLYQFIYVGDRSASKLIFELFDGDDKKIESQTLKEPKQKNFLVYSFVPDKSDVYLIVLTQKWKTRSMCGSFVIMQKETTPANK
jgi:hypothetical protein